MIAIRTPTIRPLQSQSWRLCSSSNGARTPKIRQKMIEPNKPIGTKSHPHDERRLT